MRVVMLNGGGEQVIFEINLIFKCFMFVVKFIQLITLILYGILHALLVIAVAFL